MQVRGVLGGQLAITALLTCTRRRSHPSLAGPRSPPGCLPCPSLETHRESQASSPTPACAWILRPIPRRGTRLSLCARSTQHCLGSSPKPGSFQGCTTYPTWAWLPLALGPCLPPTCSCCPAGGSGTKKGGPGSGLPEYLPPLLRLIKQRMSKRRSKRMMALTKPMNQPSAAKLEEWNLTGPEGEIVGWGERALSPSP